MTLPYRLKAFDVVTSTNDLALASGAAGEDGHLLISALEQTKGRGRLGRVWNSPKGNLYSSLLLRPEMRPDQTPHLAILAAVALGQVVAPLLPKIDCALKWPNDLLAGGKKISGVLLETSLSARGTLDYLAIGIGLNVRAHPDNAAYAATHLAAEGAKDLELPPLLAVLWQGFYHWLHIYEKQGFAPIREAFDQRAQKGLLSVRTAEEIVTGDYAGINQDGGLALLLANGTKRSIAAGDVFHAV